MSTPAEFLPWPGEENPVPSFPPRDEPMAEVEGRAPCCPVCGFLEDVLGHVWICVAPNGRLRKRAARGGEAA